jgi:hypothetical protein
MEKIFEKYKKLSPEKAREFIQMVTLTYHSCKIEGATLTERDVFIQLLEELPESDNNSAEL